MNLVNLQQLIYSNYKKKNELSKKIVNSELVNAINIILDKLSSGELRVVEKVEEIWKINEWLKQAILLSFCIKENKELNAGFTKFYDKVNLQFANFNDKDFQNKKIRIVPPACVREGAFIGTNTVLMPSYVNIGAYIGNNCMIDNWATIGSCAQIGNNVHVSMGAGIGGVLEPLQAMPVIIEDNCFIGANVQIVEGMIIEENSVIAMGVNLGASTKIYNKETKKITYGKIPKGSVVIPGSILSKDKNYSYQAAIIVKQIDKKTKAKVNINELLREDHIVTT